MPLTKAIMLGGIGGIGVPFAMMQGTGPLRRIMDVVQIPGPHGAIIPWSWLVFSVVTLSAWGLLAAAR